MHRVQENGLMPKSEAREVEAILLKCQAGNLRRFLRFEFFEV